jgi:hypothetical protein
MLLGCLIACNLSAHADGGGTERFRTLTVETVYPFKQTDFDPPVALSGVKQSADSDPMTTLQRHFDAMRSGDVDAFLATWTRSARSELAMKQLAGDAARAAAAQRWNKVLAGREAAVQTRVDFGRYVLLAYVLRDSASGQIVVKDTLAFEQEEAGWKLTQALARSPLLSNWNAPNGRVQVAPDALLDGAR